MPRVLNANEFGTIAPNSIYCGRPSKYGNKFIIGKDGPRKEVIEKHRQMVLADPILQAEIKKDLAGKNLICWCAPKLCHCDVLLQIANETSLAKFIS